MRPVALVVWFAGSLYLLVLLARMVLSLVMALSRGWRPQGPAAAAAEIVFMLTDPPVRAVGRVVKPVRVGPVALDLGFLLVFFAVYLVVNLAARLAAGF
ncbi:MAG: YggT family protein [Bifidobacteriaceae bacterium]|nr:YggT family protein [Bifidobacteriaceae bacterium]